MSVRIQRQRTKGWRMPEGAFYVGRPSRWGNPFTVNGSTGPISRLVVTNLYAAWIRREVTEFLTIDLEPLRGHDLVCWCPLDQPCHADVLLELAR